MSYRIFVVVVTLSIFMVPAFGEAEHAVGVSPGAVDRVTEIEGRCPTFFWGNVPGAMAFELVVYRIPGGPRLSNALDIDLNSCEEVLYASIPGGATAWQPELAEGLDPGESYVWFVRAVFGQEPSEELESGEWSSGRFFRVSSVPSGREVEEALSVLRRYMDPSGSATTVIDQQALDYQARSPARPPSSGRLAALPHSQKSVPTGTAAIKGTEPDASGETYGVVGISNSPDGAGVGAANTAGGPDLVLDGSEDFEPDAELSQSGIDRPWGSPQTFNIENSAGGGMTLQVDGVGVVTTATDQDTVGALTCGNGQLAKWTGTAWECAQDNNTDTLTSLGCALGEVAKWNGAAWECSIDADTLDHLGCSAAQIPKYNGSDWVCAADEDTTFSFGNGLVLADGVVSIDPTYFLTRISIVELSGWGRDTSIAIGTDGLGLISYYRSTGGDLKVAHCNDAACTNATTATLDTTDSVGQYTSITIGTDGFGLISYYDVTNGDLKVAHCENDACTSSTTTTLDSADDVGGYTSIAIGTDGFGLISYYDVTNGDLKVAHCIDTACSSAHITPLDSTGDVGWYTSITIGTDGFGLISYHNVSNADLKVAHCADTACSSATTTTLDSAGHIGWYASNTIGTDGLGLISYYDATNGALKVAHCADTACSSAATITLDSTGVVGRDISITIDGGGRGLISYYDQTNGDLMVARCGDTSCSSATTATLDSTGQVGQYTSIAIGIDGRGLISYNNASNGSLRVAHLGIGVP